jgi:hypothetical protein
MENNDETQCVSKLKLSIRRSECTQKSNISLDDNKVLHPLQRDKTSGGILPCANGLKSRNSAIDSPKLFKLFYKTKLLSGTDNSKGIRKITRSKKLLKVGKKSPVLENKCKSEWQRSTTLYRWTYPVQPCKFKVESPCKSDQANDITCILTPVSKSIYTELSPIGKAIIDSSFDSSSGSLIGKSSGVNNVVKNLLYLFDSDNNKINTPHGKVLPQSGIIENISCDDNDLTFEPQVDISAQKIGKYMEYFLSIHLECPSCKQKTLKIFQNPNTPVIDMICVNYDYHINNRTCAIFQVKTSISTSSDYNYFDKNGIMVGSVKYGKIAHLIKGTDIFRKKMLLPGYICIKIIKSDTSYMIDNNNSFCLLPNLCLSDDEYYYTYSTKKFMNKDVNIVVHNDKLVNKIKLSSILSLNKIIISENDIDSYQYEFSQISNPYTNLSDLSDLSDLSNLSNLSDLQL